MKSYRISEVHLGRARTTAKSRKVFAVHQGKILKAEFMERMGLSADERAKALNCPGIDDVVRGDRAIRADPAIRLGKHFGLPPQFWLNLQNDYDLNDYDLNDYDLNDYDLRIAEGRGNRQRDSAPQSCVGCRR
jgi:addiction module HigA family antidote